MALHLTPAEHDANPPHTWEVKKAPGARHWRLLQRGAEYPIGIYATRKEAEAAKTSGPYFDLYQKEGRWFAGEVVEGWKPYVR